MAKKKIMIIDDDPDIRSTIEQILESQGHKTISVCDGFKFFNKLRQGEKPNLILLDIMMPAMSGWEIQRRLQANPNWKQIPIIFVTGRNTETAKEMCKKYGIDYIEKPFDINRLKKKVGKALMKKKNN